MTDTTTMSREQFIEYINEEAAKRGQLQRDHFAALMAKDEEFLDDDGYPTEHALEIVKVWLWDDPVGWFEFIGRMWHLRDWGWNEKEAPHEFYADKTVRLYQISTAGWSGNEALIRAMESNIILWSTTWVQSRRGGHYIFEVENDESGSD